MKVIRTKPVPGFVTSSPQVRINRGNHEDVFMNLVSTESGGGFYQEVTMKYNAETYELFAAASS